MNDSKNQLISYFENMGLLVLGVCLLVFPLFFLTNTTDMFTLPKQIILALSVGLFSIFFILKTLTQGKFTYRNSNFHLPVILLLIVAFLSAVLSKNRLDSLISFVPFLFIVFFYFSLVSAVKEKKQLMFIISSLVLGASLASLINIAYFFKIYLFPLQSTQNPGFTTFGSFLDQAIYFALILPFAAQFIYQRLRAAKKEEEIISLFQSDTEKRPKQTGMLAFFAINTIIILAGLILTLYSLFTTQKPLILPLDFGLQIALASVSQDTGNVLKSFLFGSGIGTFLTDFTRFKTAAYNSHANLWAFTFFRSSTYVLELIATTGILGFAAFLFLVYRVFKQKMLFIPLLSAIVLSFLLPFSFASTFLLFTILAIFVVTRLVSKRKEKISETEVYFISLKRKIFGESAETEANQKRHGKFLSIIISLILLVILGVPLYFSTLFVISDLTFQKALVAAANNQGTQTYDLEVKAIQIFPYRDVYYRGFSQTNLALANILVQQQQGKQPDQQTQQNILTLIQQSINSGRTATSIAPLTSFNWNSLSAIYRSLIGFGQNADQFTLLTAKQAVDLDPNNPQQYIEYGGIYYQLGNYDEAIRQFQFAANLKQDYANAYFNLGHALELKGNLNEAMQAYQIVKKLVGNDKANTEKIDADIKNLQDKIGKQPQQAPSGVTTGENQQPLNVNQPINQLPERKPPVEIPGPTVSATPQPKADRPLDETPTPTPTPKSP